MGLGNSITSLCTQITKIWQDTHTHPCPESTVTGCHSNEDLSYTEQTFEQRVAHRHTGMYGVLSTLSQG